MAKAKRRTATAAEWSQALDPKLLKELVARGRERRARLKERPVRPKALGARLKKRVARATVRLTGTAGQGVLVPGGYILTAAHCIKWEGRGGMALGDYYLEKMKDSRGRWLWGSPAAVEPVADIAALAAPDGQVFFEECDAFERFVEGTEPVPLWAGVLVVNESMPAWVLNHTGEWVKATLTRYGRPGDPPGGVVAIHPEGPILRGTSGGPVVNEAGLLVGVVSWACGAEGEAENGLIPVAHLALPRWVVDYITRIP